MDQTRLRRALMPPVCPGPAIVPRRSQGRASALPQSVAACRRKESSSLLWLRVQAGRIRPGYKDAYGRLRRTRANQRPNTFQPIGTPGHRAVARQAVRESLVLLKNNGVLPIKPNATVLIGGDGADNIAMQAGGWTLSWQGADNGPSDFSAQLAAALGLPFAFAAHFATPK